MSALPATLLNGIETDLVSTADRGLQFGDGLFETIAYQDGHIEYWSQHIQRLHDGASRLGIDPPDTDLLLQDIRNLLEGHRQGRLVIKIMLTRGAGGRGYSIPDGLLPNRIVTVSAAPDWPSRLLTDGILARRCTHRLASSAELAGIKHLNRLDSVMGRKELASHQHEGVMYDQTGSPVEGTMSNLFCVRDGDLYTADIRDCGIDGVIRQRLITLADVDGVTCKMLMSEEILEAAQEIFFCNSLMGIWPVRRLDDKILQPGPVTHRMLSLLHTDKEANRFDVQN